MESGNTGFVYKQLNFYQDEKARKIFFGKETFCQGAKSGVRGNYAAETSMQMYMRL